MLRLCSFIAGLALASAGAMLAREELLLADARQAAREARAGKVSGNAPRFRAAYGALDGANARGTDQLDLAISLHGMVEADGRDSQIVRHARVFRAAERLARASPLDARAWCVLALAQSKAIGITPGVIEQIRACYTLGPREIGIVDGRMMFVWSAWDQLPQDVRNAAMIDVAASLENPMLAPWMANRLAYAVASVAPERAALAETLLTTYGESLKGRYEKAVENYRRSAASKPVQR